MANNDPLGRCLVLAGRCLRSDSVPPDILKLKICSWVSHSSIRVSAVSSREAELESRSSAISELISANEDLSRSRVVLEMKCVELEEQRDRWAAEEREVKQRMEVMRKELEVRSWISMKCSTSMKRILNI